MIDLFTVFHRGGVVLYERQLQAVPGHPVDSLISNVLLEERVGGAQSYRHEEKYTVKWTFANDLDLVFVAVYLNLTNLLYLDDLLVAAKDKFCSLFRDQIKADADSSAYTKKFNRIYDDLVFSYETGATKASGALPSAMPASDTIASPKKPQHSLSNKKAKADTPAAESTDDAPLFEQSTVPAAATPDKQAAAAASSPSSDAPAVNQTKLAALQAAARTGKPVHSFGKKKKGDAAAANTPEKKEPEAPAKKAKVARTWDGNKATKKEAAELDYAVKRDGDAGKSGESVISGFDSANKEGNQDAYKHVEQKSYSDDEEEEEDQAEEEEDDSSSSSSSSKSGGGGGGGFFSFIKTLVAGKVLERSDLEPVLAAMKENLNGKNVAAEISEQLAESVIKTLEGQKLASFTSVKSMVRKAVEAALTRILTPNRQIDVLAGVAEANEQKRPYSIVFVGVNGVGQSESRRETRWMRRRRRQPACALRNANSLHGSVTVSSVLPFFLSLSQASRPRSPRRRATFSPRASRSESARQSKHEPARSHAPARVCVCAHQCRCVWAHPLALS